jgi:hypothetical protein
VAGLGFNLSHSLAALIFATACLTAAWLIYLR